MDANEILLRIVRGHWRLLTACALLPVIAIAAYAFLTPPSWTAVARIQGGTVLPGSDTEADALLNVVKGVATSPAFVSRAAGEAGLANFDPVSKTSEIEVARLGSSAVFDVSVTDTDPVLARQLTKSIADDVVIYMNNAGDARTANLVGALQARQKQLLDQRQSTAKALALTKDPAAIADLSSQLSGIDQQLSDMNSTIRQLQVSGVSAAGSGSAAMISPPADAVRAPKPLGSELGIGVLAGLLVGLLLASLAEVSRPRVPGAGAFARQLAVPVLGSLLPDPASDVGTASTQDAPVVEAGTAKTVQHAARKLDVCRIALVGPLPLARNRVVASALNSINSIADTKQVNGAATFRPSPRPRVRPAENGAGTQTQVLEQPKASAASSATLTACVVVPYADIEALDAQTTTGLLAVVPAIARQSDVTAVLELVRATGWPVIGVLSDPGDKGRRKGRRMRWKRRRADSTDQAREAS